MVRFHILLFPIAFKKILRERSKNETGPITSRCVKVFGFERDCISGWCGTLSSWGCTIFFIFYIACLSRTSATRCVVVSAKSLSNYHNNIIIILFSMTHSNFEHNATTKLCNYAVGARRKTMQRVQFKPFQRINNNKFTLNSLTSRRN